MKNNSINLVNKNEGWLNKNITVEQEENKDESYISELNKIKIEVSFSKGEHLYNGGSKAEGFYLILNGKVKLIRNFNRVNENILFILVPGDITGLNATISKQSAFATAIAIEDVKALFYPEKEFLKILEKNPQLYFKLMESTIKKIEKMENRMVEMTQSASSVRLAKTLLMLNNIYSKKEEKVINLSIDHSDIAKLVNVNETTLYRLMKDFKDRKLIRYRGNRMVLNDVKKLAKIAGYEKQTEIYE